MRAAALSRHGTALTLWCYAALAPLQVTDKGLRTLTALVGLHTLGLAGCPVSDQGLVALMDQLTNLTALNLEWCAIGDAGFQVAPPTSGCPFF